MVLPLKGIMVSMLLCLMVQPMLLLLPLLLAPLSKLLVLVRRVVVGFMSVVAMRISVLWQVRLVRLKVAVSVSLHLGLKPR
jgi:hypothetical protein